MNFAETFIRNHPAQKVTIKDKQYEYLAGGKGKTTFLIFPGGGQDAMSCFDLIDEFEKKYKAIAVNYEGFYSLNSFFEYVNKILEREKIDKIILYGLSIGGFLAQHYVRRYPNKITRLVISHAGSTRSKTIIRHVALPGKAIHFILPIIPQALLTKLFKTLAGRAQARDNNIVGLYEKYSSKENYERRKEIWKATKFSMANKRYLESIYKLGVDMQKEEKKFRNDDLKDWKGKILIIRTDNDPLAQDNGVFKEYYPKAKVFTFYKTGHLTAFVQFDKMVEVIQSFLK